MPVTAAVTALQCVAKIGAEFCRHMLAAEIDP
jgi:hypothetical protein